MKSVESQQKYQFGLRIKEMRNQLQLSQDDLADAAGVFRTYMSRIETGQANPSLTVIYRLATALENNPAALFESVASEVPIKTRSKQKLSRGRV